LFRGEPDEPLVFRNQHFTNGTERKRGAVCSGGEFYEPQFSKAKVINRV
jgi:hypothetical protein